MTERPPPRYDRCLVIDDDEDILLSAQLLLEEMFAEVRTSTSPADAIAAMRGSTFDAVLLDANFARGATDGSEGFQWLAEILHVDPGATVVMITAHSSVGVAVSAMKLGATDFVSKPWNNERLLATVANAVALGKSRRGSQVHRTPASLPPSTLLGNSPAMARVRSLIEKAAPTDANVMILGENGTGKELVARELHRLSRRSAAEMTTVDLGAIAETVFDSELFGHVRGAFTDAKSDRAGRLAAADGSTLFLDEIGNLPVHLQPKLLTALEQRRVTPVGANKAVPIDVRVVSATNMRSVDLADGTRFRQDLLFRLNTVEIELPPLRERQGDVPLLLTRFLREFAERYGRPERNTPMGVMRALASYEWPGNVRALRHAAERAVILSDGDEFRIDDFPMVLGTDGPQRAQPSADERDQRGEIPSLNLDSAERQLIERALRRHGFNISHAAAELGLSRGALYRRIDKHGL